MTEFQLQKHMNHLAKTTNVAQEAFELAWQIIELCPKEAREDVNVKIRYLLQDYRLRLVFKPTTHDFAIIDLWSETKEDGNILFHAHWWLVDTHKNYNIKTSMLTQPQIDQSVGDIVKDISNMYFNLRMANEVEPVKLY